MVSISTSHIDNFPLISAICFWCHHPGDICHKCGAAVRSAPQYNAEKSKYLNPNLNPRLIITNTYWRSTGESRTWSNTPVYLLWILLLEHNLWRKRCLPQVLKLKSSFNCANISSDVLLQYSCPQDFLEIRFSCQRIGSVQNISCQSKAVLSPGFKIPLIILRLHSSLCPIDLAMSYLKVEIRSSHNVYVGMGCRSDIIMTMAG